MRNFYITASALLAVSLSACGGGGSGDTASVSPAAAGAVQAADPVGGAQYLRNDPCVTGSDNAALEAAIITGDSAALDDETVIINEILATAECARTQFNDVRAKLFNLEADGSVKADSLTAINWNPTHDAAMLTPVLGQSEAVLVSNWTWQNGWAVRNENLAVAGKTGDARHMVLGSSPMRNDYNDASGGDVQMNTFLDNTLSWLTGRDDLKSAPFNVVIAQMDDSYWFRDARATRAWLDTHYTGTVSYNLKGACNGTALAGCLAADTDLLIISQWTSSEDDNDAIIEAVTQAMAAGTPVLYTHHDGGLYPVGARLMKELKTGYYADNYWRRQGLQNFDGSAGFGELSPSVAATKTLIERLRDDSFTIDFSDCKNNSCPDESGYSEQFEAPVSAIASQINSMDRAGQNLFKTRGMRFEKLLVLLGDYYRQNASFPMDKDTTSQIEFLKSLYADQVVHVTRHNSRVQPDMGNFSRSDFSHVTPVTKTVTLTARDLYKAAGVYAIPGQTVTVTRNDNASVRTHIKVNMVRSGATHLFDRNAYNRPKYTTSQDMPIAAGETLRFTSPYGGPIQVRFDDKDMDVSLTFENVGEHAIWRGPEDDLDFAQKLEAGDYDWAELITPSFQVHSKLDKMRNTTNGPVWKSAAEIGEATETHLHNWPHVLAGFKGEGIAVVDEIHDFAAENGLELHTLDKVKHMNADQALCGYGCSGNPYDAYWSFNPLGHGDIHELGHGLERGRFRFTGQPGHTGTNPYSYYSKWKYFEQTGDTANLGCQNLPYEDLFNRVQASRTQADPAQYMRDQNLTGWNQGAAINFQIMMAAQDLGVLDDGRHLLARLHIIEREFSIADDNDTSWDAKRAGLGFESFTRTEARALSNNDWNLIALSHAMGRNVAAYLEMWGFELTDAAKAHVTAWNYPALPLDYYIAESQNHCKALPSTKLPVDGTQVWPSAAAATGYVGNQRKASVSKVFTAPPAKAEAAGGDHICNHDYAEHSSEPKLP